MKDNRVKLLGKCILGGIVWVAIAIVIGLLIVNFTSFNLNDVLFIEGMLLLIVGVLAAIGGNSMGLSLNSMGQTNAQYESYANLKVAEMEKSKINIKNTIIIGRSTVALVVGGLISIIINFII